LSASRTHTLPSLAEADWLKWPGVVQIFSALGARGHEVRAVGGAVRDVLLRRSVQDVDFATTALPETVMELATEAGLKAIPTGIDHGTVTVVAGGRPFEVTTLRKDVETYGRRAKVSYTDDWAADAGRRDFTINALYADAEGTLFDPRDGYGDIEARHIRFIGDARARVREDYLRILRFFRFNAELEAGDFDEEGLRACVIEHAGLHELSAERVRSELLRLLGAEDALKALWKMYDYGLLVQILGGVPDFIRLERMISIDRELGMEPDAVLRLAGLAVMVPEDAERLTERLRLSKSERKRLEQATDYHGMSADMDDMQVRLALYKRGLSGCHNAAFVAWAASGEPASDAGWHRLITRLDDVPIPEFPLQGSDIVQLGMPQGPAVGEILKAVEARWMADNFMAGKVELLEMAREQVRSKTRKK
jgi:tRNA nucleotidyltransferase/poly(A) polymerase